MPIDLPGLLAEDELTELVDADIPRVDLVGKGANGIPRFLIAKQDQASAGLLDPEFVRDLIAKAEPEPETRERATLPNGITVSGSPADIAAFIYKAAERGREREADGPAIVARSAAEYERVLKAKYSAENKRKMLAAGHAIENDDGDPAYPIGDEDDLSKAIHAVGRGGADHDRIRAYVIRRAKALGASSMIPDNWASDGSLKEGSVSKTAEVAKDAMAGGDTDKGMDGLDPTVVLAEPETAAPGSDSEPGSPAWEAVDAATACKWTSILARARVAVDVLAEREMLEAASADPDDMGNAMDLQDVCCAIDYAISVLAPFAVAEQSEADCGTDAMEAIGKAADGLGEPVFVIESLGAVIRKSGRVLSAANEAHIREAAQRLTTVLSSLPKAPVTDDGQPVAKEKEDGMAVNMNVGGVTVDAAAQVAKDASPDEQARDAGPAAALPKDGPQAALPGDVPGRTVIKGAAVGVFGHGRQFLGLAPADAILTDIAKADGEGKKAMCVVYNQDGALIGIVDPDDITPVSNSEAKPDEAPDEEAAPAADAGDMTPAPAASAGTPADDVAKAETKPATQDAGDTRTVLKGIVTEALAEILGAQGTAEGVAKQADVAALGGRLEDVLARLETVEKQDARPGVFANGAVPPPGSVPPARPSLRGQDQGAAAQVDVAKAQEMRAAFLTADPAEQNRLAREMQEAAIAGLAAIHGR